MTRLDKVMEARMAREREATLLAVYGGLESGVERAGGELIGISVRIQAMDCLLTLRAVFPAGAMVGFVGGEDLAAVMRKAAGEAARDQVRWQEDKWRHNGG
jgi:hypothetical protein